MSTISGSNHFKAPRGHVAQLTSKGERRQQEILSAAAVLFDRSGYHSCSIAEIAAEVGTTKANIYHYFRAKHDILLAIHEAWINELITMLERNLADATDVRQILRQVFHDVMDLIHTRRAEVRVYFEHFRDLPEELQAQAVEKRDRYELMVEELIRRGIDEGAIRASHVRVATFAMFGMTNWAYQWYHAGGSLDQHEIADMLFDIFMNGVRA